MLFRSYSDQPGVVAPLGLFDPCNILNNADQERFDHLRSLELKHGRVSMLAVVGYLVTYGMCHVYDNNVHRITSSRPWISCIIVSFALSATKITTKRQYNSWCPSARPRGCPVRVRGLEGST